MPSISISTKCTLMLAIIIVTLAPIPVATVPIPVPQTTNNQINNSYSGAGGKASGGSVTHTTGTGLAGLRLLDVFSGNAGDGGNAKSGKAFSGIGAVNVTGDSTGITNNAIGNSYSGAAGTADGGNVDDDDALISLFSGNAGDGGNANSGNSGPAAAILVPVTSTSKTKVGRMIRVRWDAVHMMD